MQKTIVLVTLTLITGIAVGCYLKARKAANELKERHPEREPGTVEAKEEEARS